MECVKHPGTPIVSACTTCDTTLVCLDCMTDELHQGHVFGKLQKIAIDIKTDLKSKEKEDFKLETSLKSDLNEIRSLKSQQENIQKERVNSINTLRDVLIGAINKIADILISQYETQTQCNCFKLQDAIDDISVKLKEVRRHRKEVERILDEKDDLVVILDSQKLKDFDGQIKLLPDLDIIEFIIGKVNTKQLSLMFGGTAAEMNKLVTAEETDVVANMTLSMNQGSDFVGTLIRQGRELVLESTFKHSDSHYVLDMCNGSQGKTWLRCCNAKEISLTDKHGHVQKSVIFVSNVRGITNVTDNELLTCGLEDRDIKRVILPSGQVTSVFSTGGLIPQYMSTTPSGDLYVTLMDKRDYNVTASSERVLVQYSPQGQEKGRARYDRRGDPLFVRPLRMKISKTGDILGVLNYTDKDNNHLVLLNTDLTLRLRYLGNGKAVSGEEKFDATTYKPETKYAINDFTFYSFENIIIAEGYSRCVQLLSKNGVLIRTLLPTQRYTPLALTMNGDEMWIGVNDGIVKVYKCK
ncbi:uncharacterized protein LOC110442287 [Mizuhopecten yessoensis]|uniref:B box-type domain-containing protein n=1 Tax=Mizuhopecten yessoensis TaxID=6573 RepID=A0A210PHK9_MIZYE|nr:uncharacterized protein LOC110442287 [Mizuhopecten yessoensis]OWF35975.1 hypothetical protein KP79_PYT22381 [Mizuhopecten yessoensis]